MYASRPSDVSTWPERGLGRRAVGRGGPPEGRRHLGLAGPRRPLEGLEDRPLGDPVAAVEVGRLGVERRDRRQLVGEVVEHEHEVGLDERRQRDADRVLVRARDRRLERADGVVRERADGAAGEPRHALGGQRRAGCGTKARSAASGSGTSVVVTGRSGE